MARLVEGDVAFGLLRGRFLLKGSQQRRPGRGWLTLVTLPQHRVAHFWVCGFVWRGWRGDIAGRLRWDAPTTSPGFLSVGSCGPRLVEGTLLGVCAVEAPTTSPSDLLEGLRGAAVKTGSPQHKPPCTTARARNAYPRRKSGSSSGAEAPFRALGRFTAEEQPQPGTHQPKKQYRQRPGGSWLPPTSAAGTYHRSISRQMYSSRRSRLMTRHHLSHGTIVRPRRNSAVRDVDRRRTRLRGPPDVPWNGEYRSCLRGSTGLRHSAAGRRRPAL